MEYRCRQEILDCRPVHHGGRTGSGGSDLIDFSVSLNPYPIPEAVRTAVCTCDPVNYPDTGASRLRERLEECLHVPSDELLVVNGVSQGIFLTAMCFLDRGDRVIIQGPTYGEYEKNSRLFGAEVHHIRTHPDNGFEPDIDLMIKTVRAVRPRLVWLCNPNNPTGKLLTTEQLTSIAECCSDHQTLLVVDEAYIQFTDTPERHAFRHPAAIIMRSMTKDFSLAGLRIAYMQADSRIIRLLRRIQPEWSLNAPALAAAEAALDSIDQYIIQWHTVRKETTFLERELRRIGLPVFSSAANFILAGFRSSMNGTVISRELFHRRLLQQGVAVRDCSSFGLPDHVRIGTRTEPENRILVSVLQQEGLWEL